MHVFESNRVLLGGGQGDRFLQVIFLLKGTSRQEKALCAGAALRVMVCYVLVCSGFGLLFPAFRPLRCTTWDHFCVFCMLFVRRD